MKTTVNNFTITINYENDPKVQRIAELFLASIESFMATSEMFEIVAVHNQITINITHTENDSELIYNQVTNIISLSLLCQYFQFFVLGLLVRQFQNQAHEIIDNKYVSASIIILFAILYGWLQIDDQYINNSTGVLHKLLLLIDIGGSWLVRYLGLIIVYAFFRKYQDSFTHTKPLGSTLQYIGRYTLDIYVLHYFFLPNITPIKEFILNTYHYWNSPNIVFELFFGIGISLMVIAVCLVVSKILRTSDLLGHYLFGAKIKDAK